MNRKTSGIQFPLSRRGLLVAPFAINNLGAAESEVWRFDRLERLGRHKTRIEGNPKVIETPQGRAVQFDGVKDALFVDVHPLAGAREFTWEVIFRPASDGRPEQRFFHLQEDGTKTRMLLETRMVEGKWALDTYADTPTGAQALLDKKLLHTADAWHHVALVYDGNEMRHYIDGALELKANVALSPQGAGKTSVGVRINRVDYFKGAIQIARFTKRALGPEKFLKLRA